MTVREYVNNVERYTVVCMWRQCYTYVKGEPYKEYLAEFTVTEWDEDYVEYGNDEILKVAYEEPYYVELILK